MIAMFCGVLLLVVLVAFGLAMVWLVDTCEFLPFLVMLLLFGVAFAGLSWLSFGFQRLYHAPDAVAVEKGGRP